jgi:hypothetical protein
MKRRTVIVLLGVLAAGGLAASLAAVFRPFEPGPRYKGMPISYWRNMVSVWALQNTPFPQRRASTLTEHLEVFLGFRDNDRLPSIISGDPEAVPALLYLLGTDDSIVVYVLYALTQTKSFPPPGEFDADKYLKAVPAQLRSQNYWASILAAELLHLYSRGAGTATVAELAALLHDENVSARWQAVKLLGKMGTKAKATIPELTELLNDNSLVRPWSKYSETISSEAAEALRQIDPEAAERAAVK